jgi:hypothetical protein
VKTRQVHVDPDVPNWLLTKRGGLALPIATVLSAGLLVASILASLLVGGGSLTVVAVVLLVVAVAVTVWAVVDVVWWSIGGRRRIIRLPRDPDA